MAEFGQLDFTFQAMPVQRRIWTVASLVGAVRTHIEREYADIWVEGEISNFRPADSGHLYFTLKENGAQLRVVMFRSQARLLRFRPENGLHIVARGRVTVYEDRGELQLMAEFLEPKGAGALQVAFEQLKAKLASEGLFDTARKKPIPVLPNRIGVVTSARGAAIQDILNIIRRRHESVHILIYPAQVQGEYAPGEVSAGIRYFNRASNVDVIIVARGGGSLEDLAAFNDEALARTVAASKIPIISAVGHETDFTICDFVADLRAPTPSAAAELVVRSKHEVASHTQTLHQRLSRAMRYQLLRARQGLTTLAQHGAFARITDLINRRQQRVDELVYRLATAERHLLRRYRQRVDVASARVRHHDLRRQFTGALRVLDGQTNTMVGVMRSNLLRSRSRLNQVHARLEALSPLSILDRGYALVYDADGNLLRNVAQVNTGETIRARVAKGELTATVETIRQEPEPPKSGF